MPWLAWPPSRSSVVVAWATGAAGAYVLLSMLHAVGVERLISVDIAFGRSLAFWVTSLYVGLPLWALLPREPSGWYACRRIVAVGLVTGALGALVCAGVLIAWLARRWNPSVGWPVVGSLLAVLVVAAACLWIASRDAEPGN